MSIEQYSLVAHDWLNLEFIINDLTQRVVGQELHPTSSPTFGSGTITGTCLIAGGANFLRVTGLQTDDTALTGTLRGAYIDVSNGSTAATGTIRALELKARTEAPGDTGNDVAVLEGLSISADSKAHSVATMRAAEFILDGSLGGTIDEAVGLRIANNLQIDKATVSYGLQIYRDSFDYTADIQLSSGGLIGGSAGALQINTDDQVIINKTSAAYPFLINSTDGSDQIEIYHDSFNTYFKTTDGHFKFMTDEGDNTNTAIDVLGKGTGLGSISVYDQDNFEYFSLHCTAGKGRFQVQGINPVSLSFQHTADIPIYFFENATEGETQPLQICGYGTGSGSKKTFVIEVEKGDVADTVYLDGLTNYLFGGNLITLNNTHENTDGGGETYHDFKRQDGAGTETTAARIEGSHDGAVANDQLGRILAHVNTGEGLVQALEIGSDLLATFAGAVNIATIAAEGTDVDKFLVDSTGVIKYRTGAQILSDIGASASSHLHDGATLQNDAVNSDGGAFSFTTTGAVTFNQPIAATNYAAANLLTACATNAGGLDFTAASKTLSVDETETISNYHTDSRAATWLAANHETTYTHTDIALNTTHRGLVAGNPHSVTPTELGLVIGTNTQAWNAGLDSLAGLTYAAAAYIKMTGANTFALRTIANVRTDLSITNVEDTAISTWAGSGHITTVGALAAGSIAAGFTEIATDYTAAKCTDATADNTAGNETSHADVLVDGDFGSNGILNRTGLGAYSILALGTDVQAHGAVLDDLNTLGANPFSGDPNADFLVGTSAGGLAWQSGATARTSLGLGTEDSLQFAKLGVNIAAPASGLVYILNPAVDSAGSYTGSYNRHTKTAGASTVAHTLYGSRNRLEYNQSGGTIGYFHAGRNQLIHTDGNVGDVGNNRQAYTLFNLGKLDGGKIWGDFFCESMLVDQGAGHEITRNVAAMYLLMDLAGTVGGTSYMLYMSEGVGVDYGIYQAGTAMNVLGGPLMVGLKTGTDQTDAGAATGELYVDTNDDNTVKMGV